MKRKQNPLIALLALLCAAVMLFSLLPAAAFAEEAGEDGAEEEIVPEESPAPDLSGQLVIGSADGSAGENEGKTIVIASAEDFKAFSDSCRTSLWSVGLTVLLETDIDFGNRAVMPVPSFSGTFCGNGHTISNFRCASNGSHQGLFRFLEEGGRILDLNVTGTVMPSGSRGSVGGIVGTNHGSIVGCSFSGTVEGLVSVGGIAGENLGVISDCVSGGSINGKHFAGGIVGYSEGTILRCTNRAAVNIEIRDETVEIESLDIRDFVGVNLVSAEDENTVSDIGGVAGISLGLIADCANEALVGYQHYGYNIGGVAGRQSGQIQNCVNNGAVFGRKDVGGIVGQMEPYLILDTSASLADEIRALQAAMDKAMDDMDTNSASLDGSAQLVRDSGEGIASTYVDQAIDDQSGVTEEREKQERREDFLNALSGAGSAIGDAAGGLSDETISNLTSGQLTDEDRDSLINAGGGLALEGGTGLSDRISDRIAQRDAELAAAEAENARMRAEYASLSSGLSSMGHTLHGTFSGLAGDMRSVSEHYSNILTMFTNALSGNLQLHVMEDISDYDTDEDMNGKLLSCVNNGDVNGDSAVGGVTGSMAVEAEFDLEGILSASITDSVQISTDSYFARCIVRKCVNNGAVAAKKDHSGGVCGLSELGLISNAENYGAVSAGGNYCGGVVGQSKSVVSSSYAMCPLEGAEYVGGIAGQGRRVVGCSSIVDMDASIACSGAICGWADAEDDKLFIYHNTFVSDALGGVDGISYDQAAVPVSFSELCAQEGLPERFRTLKVTFRANDAVVAEFTVPYGGGVDPADIPAVPELEGCSGYWPTTDLSGLNSSLTIDAVYLNRVTGLAADYTREGSPLPVVIVEGLFEPGSEVHVSDWSERVTVDEGYRLCEALELELSSRVADLESYAVHYLTPREAIGNGRALLLVRGENGLEPCPYEIDGSYMIFRATGSDLRFCVLVSRVSPAAVPLVALAAALAAGLLVFVLLRRKGRMKAAARPQTPAEEKETVGAAK